MMLPVVRAVMDTLKEDDGEQNSRANKYLFPYYTMHK